LQQIKARQSPPSTTSVLLVSAAQHAAGQGEHGAARLVYLLLPECPCPVEQHDDILMMMMMISS
jgi:hypothetical protein